MSAAERVLRGARASARATRTQLAEVRDLHTLSRATRLLIQKDIELLDELINAIPARIAEANKDFEDAKRHR